MKTGIQMIVLAIALGSANYASAAATTFSGSFRVIEDECNLMGGPEIAHGGPNANDPSIQLQYAFDLDQRGLEIREVFNGEDAGSAGIYPVGEEHFPVGNGGAVMTENSVQNVSEGILLTSLDEIDNQRRDVIEKTEILMTPSNVTITVTKQNGSSTQCVLEKVGN